MNTYIFALSKEIRDITNNEKIEVKTSKIKAKSSMEKDILKFLLKETININKIKIPDVKKKKNSFGTKNGSVKFWETTKEHNRIIENSKAFQCVSVMNLCIVENYFQQK